MVRGLLKKRNERVRQDAVTVKFHSILLA